MLNYEGDLPWPVMPEALARALIRRYEVYGLAYGYRWLALYQSGYLPGDPGAEVFEAANSTMLTFWNPNDPVTGEPTPQDRGKAVILDNVALDWLITPDNDFTWGNGTPLPGVDMSWPWPALFFRDAYESTQTIWVVWHMYLLLLAEEVLSVFAKDWRDFWGVHPQTPV